MTRWIFPSRWFQRARHTHIENKGLKVLALLLALLLFAVSRQPISVVRLSGVPLEFRGISQGIEISGDVSQTVSVRVRGPRDIVKSLTPNQLSVIATLNNKEPGERIVQLKAEDVSHLDNVEVVQIDPPSIKIRLEPTVRRVVKVIPQFEGQVEEGLEIYSRTVDPSTIEIEGPKSLVEKINDVLTETINLRGRKSGFSLQVDVETSHNSLRVKTPGPINLMVEIGERRIPYRIEKVQVQGIDQIPGYRLLTKTVDIELHCPKASLKDLQTTPLSVVLKKSGHQAPLETAEPEVIIPPNLSKHIVIDKITPKEVRLKRQ